MKKLNKCKDFICWFCGKRVEFKKPHIVLEGRLVRCIFNGSFIFQQHLSSEVGLGSICAEHISFKSKDKRGYPRGVR